MSDEFNSHWCNKNLHIVVVVVVVVVNMVVWVINSLNTTDTSIYTPIHLLIDYKIVWQSSLLLTKMILGSDLFNVLNSFWSNES